MHRVRRSEHPQNLVGRPYATARGEKTLKTSQQRFPSHGNRSCNDLVYTHRRKPSVKTTSQGFEMCVGHYTTLYQGTERTGIKGDDWKTHPEIYPPPNEAWLPPLSSTLGNSCRSSEHFLQAA